MTKPIREFNANEGDYSIGLAGPDAIEADLDKLMRMFDPLTTHDNGRDGGIGTDNIRDGAITDTLIGTRILNDQISQAYTNEEKIGVLLSFIAKSIKEIKGTGKWNDTVADSIKNISQRIIDNLVKINQNKDNLSTHKTSSDHDFKYYTKTLLDGGQLDNRYYTQALLNNGQLDNRYYTETEIDDKVSYLEARDNTNDIKLNNHKNSSDHDNRYYSREELVPFLRGGDTFIKEEVYTIVTPNNGDGTFNYTDGETSYIGEFDMNGYQIFDLKKGVYAINENMIEVIINDTLRRSTVSGGIVEIDGYTIGLVDTQPAGTEITIRYYERLALSANYTVVYSDTKPPANNGKNMWFKTIG